MPTLLLRFPAGRYHATPHGHHVNEGLVEWPPSPWRLLRALIGCGYATQGWAEIPPAGRRLIEALADTLPSYRLPPASVAHSRHFMPLAVLDKGREKTTLVFDSWADIGDGTLAVRWNCALDDECDRLFAALASNLGYLGRSESWVIAESVRDDVALPAGVDAFPHVEGQRPGHGWEQVSLVAAEPIRIYASWRAQALIETLPDALGPAVRTKPSAALLKKRAAAEATFPVDILDCLQRDTAWWKQHRWSHAPGSRRVLYWRSIDALSAAAPVVGRRSAPPRVEMMLLALATPSGRLSALPPMARALPQAELLHKALVSRVGRGERVSCPELTGRDADGQPLREHRHAHILPLDLDADGRIDHVVIYARMGLGPDAQSAVRALKRTWTKGGVGDLQLALAGHGTLDDLRALPGPLSGGVNALLGAKEGAVAWRTVTPLVLPRHEKRRGTNALEGQVLAELAARGLPAARVDVLPWNDQTLKLRHAVRVRRYPAKAPPTDAGYAIRLLFTQPVCGPISLGYASHFGLGLFVAE